MTEPHKDFFISHHQADVEWAHWIGWELEQAGYAVILAEWDLQAGADFIVWLHSATITAGKVMMLLSEDYLAAQDRAREWTGALLEGRLMPVRVKPCQPKGVLASLHVIDLCNLNLEQARARLRTELLKSQGTRSKPLQRPTFPGRNHLSFPGVKATGLVGTTLAARYQVVGRLAGEGGMGEVYLAKESTKGEWRAIKILKEAFRDDPLTLERFRREGKTAMGIRHDGVVQVLDQGESEGFGPFLVMEYLDGQTLREWLRDWPPGRRGQFSQVLSLFQQIAATLAAMHDSRIIHRDLKPENVMVLENGNAALVTKVLDFGLAGPPVPRDAALTSPGVLSAELLPGTPAYMAPECWDPSVGEIGEKTDVYALGIMLYEGICGRLPFQDEDAGLLSTAHISRRPPPLDKKISRKLTVLLQRMLAKTPDARPSMIQVAQSLAPVTLPAWLIPVITAGLTAVAVVILNMAPGTHPHLDMSTISITDFAVARTVVDMAESRDFSIPAPPPKPPRNGPLGKAPLPSIKVQFVARLPREISLSCTGTTLDDTCTQKSTALDLPADGKCKVKACSGSAEEKDFNPKVYLYKTIKEDARKKVDYIKVVSGVHVITVSLQ